LLAAREIQILIDTNTDRAGPKIGTKSDIGDWAKLSSCLDTLCQSPYVEAPIIFRYQMTDWGLKMGDDLELKKAENLPFLRGGWHFSASLQWIPRLFWLTDE
jgi:hypothetical protein